MSSKKKNSRLVNGIKFDINSFTLDKVIKAYKAKHKAKKENKK